jgi:hypothetical protein
VARTRRALFDQGDDTRFINALREVLGLADLPDFRPDAERFAPQFELRNAGPWGADGGRRIPAHRGRG